MDDEQKAIILGGGGGGGRQLYWHVKAVCNLTAPHWWILLVKTNVLQLLNVIDSFI